MRLRPNAIPRPAAFLVLSLAMLVALALSLAGLADSPARADERLKGIACRSVHFQWPGPAARAYYQEIKVERSAPGTYFAVCGWDRGYYGLQELGNGKKVLIFSVWDSSSNDPNAARPEDRVKLLHQDPAVRVARFGGEGSGGQSFYDFDWQLGQTYRFAVLAQPQEQRTAYAGYFFEPTARTWKHLITYSTITGGRPLSGYYSFVEDFKRDKISPKHLRQASFGPGWLRTAEGTWQPLRDARFTADANPVLNIDAGLREGRFFLATGGEITNANTLLNERVRLETENLSPPHDLPSGPAAAQPSSTQPSSR